ncbi:MAG: alkaline phosphatase family protein [Bdellovibrionota bacterium]
MKTLALFLLAITTAQASPPPGKHFQRLILVILENTSYDEAIHQPFLASLAQRGALLANYQAVTHPSQPNYNALISGDTQGVSGDSNVNLNGRHIGDTLEEKGLDWRNYAEAFPGNCYLGSSSGSYARKHVPFLSFRSVQRDPARCAKVVNASQFDADAAAGTLPALSLYSPDLNNDGHDTNPAFADHWLKGKFEKLLSDPAFMAGTLFAVTFDENDDVFGSGPNQVFTALSGPMVKAENTVNDPLTHYSLLKMIEDNWQLAPLTSKDSAAASIEGIWAL